METHGSLVPVHQLQLLLEARQPPHERAGKFVVAEDGTKQCIRQVDTNLMLETSHGLNLYQAAPPKIGTEDSVVCLGQVHPIAQCLTNCRLWGRREIKEVQSKRL